MDYEELDNYWIEGYNAGYRRAIEYVKNEIEKGDPHKDIDKFLANLVNRMFEDWVDD